MRLVAVPRTEDAKPRPAPSKCRDLKYSKRRFHQWHVKREVEKAARIAWHVARTLGKDEKWQKSLVRGTALAVLDMMGGDPTIRKKTKSKDFLKRITGVPPPPRRMLLNVDATNGMMDTMDKVPTDCWYTYTVISPLDIVG